jgi:hypothetical protein
LAFDRIKWKRTLLILRAWAASKNGSVEDDFQSSFRSENINDWTTKAHCYDGNAVSLEIVSGNDQNLEISPWSMVGSQISSKQSSTPSLKNVSTMRRRP